MLTKIVNGVEVQMTDAEEAAFVADRVPIETIQKNDRNTARHAQIAKLTIDSVSEIRGAVLGTPGAEARLRALDNQIKALQGQIES